MARCSSFLLLLAALVCCWASAANAGRNPLLAGVGDMVQAELEAARRPLVASFLDTLGLSGVLRLEEDTVLPLVGPRLTEQRMNLRASGLPPLLTASNGEPEEDVGQYAGYFRLNRTHDARMFYFFFESRNNKSRDPLVLWMTGGPGCSSELALFYENGPFNINKDNSTLSWNPYGWDMASNIIFVDQPINTGFSYSSDPRDMRHDEDGVGDDMYEFFQAFYDLHPEFKGRDFFVTGESYGGHYVPAVSSRIAKGNKLKQGTHIALKGFAIGNGLTRPEIQYSAFPDYSLKEGLITEKLHKALRRAFIPCDLAIKACGSSGEGTCEAAFVICGLFFQAVFRASGDNLNVYDIRLPCTYQPLCYDFSPVEKYLNQPKVREELGVGDRVFQECSPTVYQAMLRDFMRNIEPLVPPLVEDGIRMLIYAGEKDFICNWLGNIRWVSAMEWTGKAAFNDAAWKPFEVDGEAKGISTGAGPVTYLKMYNAGHMVPMDQPVASLEMLRRFLKDEPFGTKDKLLPSPHPTAKGDGAAEAAEALMDDVEEAVAVATM